MMMLEDYDDDEICCGGGGSSSGGGAGGGGKKRRLGLEQVRALERCFEVENKLEPERKARLAQELGLQPRQVAVWFQNRRARWKTKQLDRDFAVLKSSYDSLRLEFDSLRRDHHSLLSQIAGLKSRLGPAADDDDQILLVEVKQEEEKPAAVLGSSDSGSSAVLTDDSSPLNSSVEAGGGAQNWGWREAEGGIVYEAQKLFEMEQCSAALFSDEHAPNLAWLCADLAGGGAAGW